MVEIVVVGEVREKGMVAIVLLDLGSFIKKDEGNDLVSLAIRP